MCVCVHPWYVCIRTCTQGGDILGHAAAVCDVAIEKASHMVSVAFVYMYDMVYVCACMCTCTYLCMYVCI